MPRTVYCVTSSESKLTYACPLALLVREPDSVYVPENSGMGTATRTFTGSKVRG
jgi:hypothetical protein